MTKAGMTTRELMPANEFLLENAIEEIRAALFAEDVPGMWMEMGRLLVRCRRRGRERRGEIMQAAQGDKT